MGFVLRRLRLYFENQVDRFCAHLVREEPAYASVQRGLLEELAAAGVDYDDLTDTLEREGVEKFSASFDELLQALGEKQAAPAQE